MDLLKDAFQKVKKDIDFLREEIGFLKHNLKETQEKMVEMCEIMEKINKKTLFLSQKSLEEYPTDRQKFPTQTEGIQTDNSPFKAPNTQILPISTGNRGVPTDRQTDNQTDRQTQNYRENLQNSVENVTKMLDSLDGLKKEIRLKFKRLTEKEMLIFSSIYQFDEEKGYSDYKSLSQHLNLSESSIRDYVGNLIKKGIPVEKTKINNKSVRLSVSKSFKKIASLSTVLQLREI